MSDLATTLTAIATGLDTIEGLRVHPDGLWPDTVNPPAALIEPLGNAEMVLDDSSIIERIRVLVVTRGGGPYESAQKVLLAYCANNGASSVQAALRTALRTSLISLNRREYGTFQVGEATLAGAAWELEVICE